MEFRDNPIIHSLNVEEWERLPSDLVSIQWYPSNPKKQREKQGETSFGSVCIYVLWPSTASVTFQVSTFPFISLQYYQPFLTSTDSFYNYWILIQILLSLSLYLSELLKSTDFCPLPVASQVGTFHQWPWDKHINYAFGLLLQRAFIGYSQVSGFVAQGIFAFGDLGLYWCSRMGSSDEKVVAVIMVGGPTKGMKLLWSLDPTMRPFSSFLWILVIVLWILIAKSNTFCNNGTQFLLL